MLKALIIDNGIGGMDAFPSQEGVEFTVAATGPDFNPDLRAFDLLIVPNGTDHVAMFRIRDQVREFLNAGKSLFCFCGWFMNWMPGHRWIHDNSKATRDVLHYTANDPHSLLSGVDLSRLDRNSHGISGWWACGYIEPASEETVLVKDTWGRALIIADDRTTRGFMLLTASGPVGAYSSGSGDNPIAALYRNAMTFAIHRKISTTANTLPRTTGVPQ